MINGGKVTFDKSFIRNISKIYWLFLFLDWLIGIVTAGTKRQKYTDRMAGTIVVQTKQPFASINTSATTTATTNLKNNFSFSFFFIIKQIFN